MSKTKSIWLSDDFSTNEYFSAFFSRTQKKLSNATTTKLSKRIKRDQMIGDRESEQYIFITKSYIQRQRQSKSRHRWNLSILMSLSWSKNWDFLLFNLRLNFPRKNGWIIFQEGGIQRCHEIVRVELSDVIRERTKISVKLCQEKRNFPMTSGRLHWNLF